MGRRSDIHKLIVSRYAEAPPLKPGKTPQPTRPHGPDTDHHLIPRSRGGETKPGNLMVVPERLHQAWHYIFRNMTPEEAMIYIAAQWAPAGYVKFLQISNGRFEIVMTGRDLIALRGKDPDRPNVPGFADAKLNAHIKEVYRRRNKRRRRR